MERQENRNRIQKELEEIRNEFKKHFMTFIVGAFSILTGLLWKTFFDKMLIKYQHVVVAFFPNQEYMGDLFVASTVTIIAVFTVIALDRYLIQKEKEKPRI